VPENITSKLRRIHVIYVDYVDLENLRWNIRLFYVEKWSLGRQILFNVESTSIQRSFILRSVRWIFTSKSICADMGYFSTSNQRRFNVEISLSTRTVDYSSTSNIRRFHVDASPTVFVDFSTFNARWFNVDISQSIRPVDSSTLNIRQLHVEVFPR